MKLTKVLVLVLFIRVVFCLKPWKNFEKTLEERQIWNKVGFYETQAMKNDDSAKNGRIEVGILTYLNESNGLLEAEIMKESGTIVVENLAGKAKKSVGKDFVIILLRTWELDLQIIVNKDENFFRDFPYKLTKFIILIDGFSDQIKKSTLFCSQFQSIVAAKGYTNVLCIEAMANSLESFRLEKVHDGHEIVSVPMKYYRFPVYDGKLKNIDLLQYEIAPYSYINDGKALGIDGYALDVFCKKYGIKYTLVNNDTHQPKNVSRYFHDKTSVVSFNPWQLNLDANDYEEISLNELDGLCFLAPKIIPTSNKAEYFTYPFDLITTILLVSTTAVTIFLWKAITIYQKSEVRMAFILFEIYKCAIGISVTGFEQMCRKEKLLIFSYVVVSMLLVSMYQSIMISFMLIEPVTRCFKDANEINESSTEIYQYFGYPTEVNFRESLIMNKLYQDSTFSLHVPEKFNPLLVYLVPCSYAEAFVRTKRNFKGRHQYLDKVPIPLKLFSQSFKIANGFPMRKEMKWLADGLKENGIKKFWIKKLVREKMDPLLKSKEKELKKKWFAFLDLKLMVFPFMVLGGGITTGTAVFLMEQILRICLWRQTRVIPLVVQRTPVENILIQNTIKRLKNSFIHIDKKR